MKKTTRWLAAVGAMIVLVSCLAYNRFISDKIYEESSTHLVEVYSHVDHAFSALVTRNWNLLNDWSGYIPRILESGSVDLLEDMVESGKENWGFTEFLFLDAAGNYITPDGRQGVLRLNHQLTSDTISGTQAVINGTMSTGEQLTVFASYIEPGEYMGVPYGSIAFSYSSAAMDYVMDMSAFDHSAGCYVVTESGDTLFSSGTEQSPNYITLLAERADFERGSLEGIRQGMASGDRGVVQYTLDGVGYFMAYLPVESQNWVLLGIVPASVVGVSIDQVRWVTIALMAAIFAVAVTILVIHLRLRMKDSLRQRDLEIQYREQLFRTLIHNGNDIYIMLPADSLQADYVSANVEEMLGIPADTLRQDIRQLIQTAEDEEQRYSLEALSQIPLNDSRTIYRSRLHQKNGQFHWYRETTYHVMIEDLEKYVLVMSDQTRERQIQEHLEQALDIAKSANEAKSMFLSNMSHDIRTPMNAVIGFTSLLEKDAEDPEKVRTYARKIAAAGRHLLSLINDILDMSKIESGKTSLNITEFLMGDLLESLDTVVKPQAKAKRQKFHIRVEKVQYDRLLGDLTRISQILLNLLSNAVKYTQEEGEIELYVTTLPQTSRTYSRLRFVVKDNGFGMSPEYVKAVFDPFSREENSNTSKIQGTGLGMAITKSLVDLMGGSISVESVLGEGSTFTLELELRIAEVGVDPGFWKRNGIERILLADNDGDVCRNIQYLMADTGVEVDYTTSSREAVAMVIGSAQNMPYSLLLIDWRMPDIDGVEAIRRIRGLVPSATTPILVFSAYDWSEIRSEALEAGADGFLAKPFFISTLCQAIEELHDASSPAAPAASDGASLAGLHFLAAEDNEINAELLAEFLAMEGATCDIAENGQAALDMFCNSAPGVYSMILMDVQMPVMDGYAATQAIRASSHPEAKTIPITAMTANAFAEDVRKAMDAGMNAHITKPVDLDALVETVQKLIQEER